MNFLLPEGLCAIAACYIGSGGGTLHGQCQWFRDRAGTTAVSYVVSNKTPVAEVKATYVNGLLQSIRDRPAHIWKVTLDLQKWTQIKTWYHNGLIHRDNDKPAVVTTDGCLEFWVNGVLNHRRIIE